jgi:hypothetical protein
MRSIPSAAAAGTRDALPGIVDASLQSHAMLELKVGR